MKAILASVKLLGTLLATLVAAPLLAQVVAIRAGAVIDPARGTSAKEQVILVEGGKIKAIGAGVSIPAGAEIIDLSHEWITPGLIDAHTHMTLSEIAGDAPFESFYLNQSSTLRGLRGLHNATTCCWRDSPPCAMSATAPSGP
jgi:imidazolonepropionase-like amidohydrolase